MSGHGIMLADFPANLKFKLEGVEEEDPIYVIPDELLVLLWIYPIFRGLLMHALSSRVVSHFI